ncbi:unnamed protein product [Brachionus calyciflorus]|uniref:Uncharacterized protein n=1 Tax=Brachionus calyciflorus TaxID=104777 RepID=A0A814DQF0_9BILA|nr:unnamed protein product [Brachionus calyciflorus]
MGGGFFSGFNGACIGAFKRLQDGVHHRLITSSLTSNEDFNYSSKDLVYVVFRLFILCDFEIFNSDAIRILSYLIEKNPIISDSPKLKSDEIDQLILIKNKCIENFSTVEDAFGVSDTQASIPNLIPDVVPDVNTIQNENSSDNNDGNQSVNITLDKSFFEESLNKLRLEFESQLNQLKIQNNDPELYLTSERIRVYEVKIKHLFNKKLRNEKNICILQKHIEKNDAPSQLYHMNFPEPFLKHNAKFVSDYNDYISQSQKYIMNLAIKHLNDEIKILEKDLKFFKKNLVGCVDSVEEFVNDIETSKKYWF